MYPYHYSYDLPASMPRYVYGPASTYGRAEPQYLHALAEEEAARRQYQQALRDQENARSRAARARLARQAYESPYEPSSYNSYIADDDDYGYGYGPRIGRSANTTFSDYPYLSPQEQRTLFQERQRVEQQRRLEALEREREKERERIRVLEEERRRRLLEEERRRRIMLEEEERQRRKEEERRRRDEEDYLRRQSSFSTFSPLDELLGFRPSRYSQPETSNSRRARTQSPGHRARTPSTTQPRQQLQSHRQTPARERSSSRSPGVERIPISSPKPTPKSTPSQPAQPTASPSPRPRSPRRFTAEEVDAAEKIQTFWRTHRPRRAALASIASLTAKFEQVKSAFTLPAALDYTHNGQVVSVPTSAWDESAAPEEVKRTSEDANLAYTPTNVPLHAYEEELNRILTKLDGVQSGGDELVRNRRRDLVRKVEREAERIEKVKVLVWRTWVGRQTEESNAMAVDEDSQKDAKVEAPTTTSEEPSSPSTTEEEPVHPADEMQVDAEPIDSSANPVALSTPTFSTKEVEVAPAEESMQIEPSSSSSTDEQTTEPKLFEPASELAPELSVTSEPTDVVLEDAAPSTSVATDEMQVEEQPVEFDAPTEDVSVEEAEPTSVDAPEVVVDEPSPETVPIIIEEPDPDVDEQLVAEPLEEVEEEETPSENIVHPPLTATVSSPTDPISSPPAFVDSASEAGDSTPPHTPPAAHDELPAASVSEADGSATPKSQAISTEKLLMLRPLVTQEWDEEIDFF